MADRLVFRPQGDPGVAQRIIDAFAQQTGLRPQPAAEGGVEFPLETKDHRIKVVQTLTAIDAEWAQHVELGDPSHTDRPGDAG
ncbi:MAG: hypothetical protein JWO90_1421 [Solirubrobacterales bacterium]|nr:hypothetical protein [Solirubrobacterales bacterium]